jgi:hypothetical protein
MGTPASIPANLFSLGDIDCGIIVDYHRGDGRHPAAARGEAGRASNGETVFSVQGDKRT